MSMTLGVSMESDSTHEIIPQLRQEAESLDRKIGNLKVQLAQLEARRETIRVQLSTVVYNVNALPPEVLGHVFVTSAALTEHKEVNLLLLSITSVCRRWRNVAIADPTVWQRLCYVPGNRGEDDRLFDCFVERSRGLPISITVDDHNRLMLPPALLKSCAQWKDANIIFPGGAAVDFSILDTTLSLPHLETLTIFLWIKSGHGHHQCAFSEAPRLRTLSVGFTHLLHQLGFPLQQLVKLTILYHSLPHDILALLPQLSTLEELSLGSIAHVDYHGTVGEIFHLKSLTALSLLGEGSTLILPHVRLPRLVKLHLSCLDSFDVTLLARPGLLRSFTNLSALEITLRGPQRDHNSDVSLSGLCKLHSLDIDLPVQHLTVTLADMPTTTKTEVIAAFSRPEFLPNLECLTLIVPMSVTSQTVRPFVAGISRRAADAVSRETQHAMKLRRLIVESEKPPNAISGEDMLALSALQHRLLVG
ncbi:MYND-type domain-containing protein [Mycena indigotica]|uniref:MYND-type domain-containing protein n=1 Tax=Mycena indigotica TaxID=2126181 RepID=A0A8H6S0D7_9AGAR|nr:MYND-type domain-containing protein [Mycena indigotica]KAF7290152.1 MYND-type domain-containing protein [Mycena indigotica]